MISVWPFQSFCFRKNGLVMSFVNKQLTLVARVSLQTVNTLYICLQPLLLDFYFSWDVKARSMKKRWREGKGHHKLAYLHPHIPQLFVLLLFTLDLRANDSLRLFAGVFVHCSLACLFRCRNASRCLFVSVSLLPYFLVDFVNVLVYIMLAWLIVQMLVC